MLDYGLYGKMMGKNLALTDDETKANALLRLLDLTVGTSEGIVIPHDLTDALDRIRKVAPAIADAPAFPPFNLRSALNLHETQSCGTW